jgi:WD40 repeat protein
VIGVILLAASIVAGSIPFILPDYEWAGKETYTILSDASVTEKGNPLESIAWSPNGRWLATACVDGTIKIMDGMSYLLRSTFHVNDPLIFSISWSPNSSWLASGDGLGISIWDVSRGNLVKFIDMNVRQVYSVAFSPDGRRIASGSTDSTNASSIRIWNVADWTLQVNIQRPADMHYQVVWLDHGNRLLSWAPEDITPVLWNPSNGAKVDEFPGNFFSVLSCSPDGNWMVYGVTRMLELQYHDIHKINDARYFDPERRTYSSAWSMDGKRLAYGTNEGIRVWNMANIKGSDWKQIGVAIDPGSQFTCVAWSPDGKRLAGGTNYGELMMIGRDSDGDGVHDSEDLFPTINNRPLNLTISLSVATAIWFVLILYVRRLHGKKSAMPVS